MKKSLWLITLVALCILTCSCGQKEQQSELPTYERITESQLEYGEIETGTVAGDYIYRSIDDVLVKYHIPTGTASTVCPDVFCDHNYGSCPFAVSSHNLASIGNILYYSLKIDDTFYLRSYHGDDMKYTEIRSVQGIINNLFTYNYYLYFTETIPTENEGQTKSTIYRWDTQSGAFDVIDCGHPYAKMDSIELGRIIWSQGNKVFSTDLNGEDERAYNQTYQREWGKYVYRWDYDYDKQEFSRLFRKDLTTGEEILIGQNMYFFFFYGDKVLYFKYTDTPRYVTSDAGTQMKDKFGGNVYIMNSDGTNDHLLCHVDDFYFFGMSSDRNNEYVCGDWVGMHSQNSYLNEQGSSMLDLTDMLFVNVVTEEYKLIKFNPYE